jgi:hypothetical protein
MKTTNIEKLTEEIQSLIDNSFYHKAATLAQNSLGVKFTILGTEYKKHFQDDKHPRHVFKIKLQRGRNSYSFQFGQSIQADAEEPTMYDVLTCLTKYDPGTFEDFCSEFGYDEDSRKAEKIYKAVCKEFEGMKRLFSPEELDTLSYIQ